MEGHVGGWKDLVDLLVLVATIATIATAAGQEQSHPAYGTSLEWNDSGREVSLSGTE